MDGTKTLWDYAEGMRRKNAGQAKAALTRGELLDVLRRIAVELIERHGATDADEVQQHAERRGYDLSNLGPATGSLFKPAYFVFSGERIRSKRAVNHGRELKRWTYDPTKGAP